MFRFLRQNATGQGGFPTQPRKLKRWLDELPLVNMGDATRQFYEGLKLLNASELSPTDRLELLEIMRPMGNTILRHLGKHFVNRTLPLPEKSRRIAELNTAVTTELATSYTRIVNELTAAGSPREKVLAPAAYRAMRHWGDIVLNSWRLYETPPPGTWREIYRLYRAAEAHGVQDKPVADDTVQGRDRDHISRYFKAICLLALTHPLSLRQGETDRAAGFLARAADSAVISAEIMPDTNDGVHALDLDSDEPPAYQKAVDTPRAPAIRGINLAPLTRQIRDHLQAPANAGRDMNRDLLGRMLEGWTRTSRRRFSRASRDDEINVVVGLPTIHAIIASELEERLTPGQRTLGIDHLALQTIADNVRKPNGDEASFLSQSDALGDAQAWDMVGRGNVITETYVGHPPVASPITAVGIRNDETQARPWQMVNASAGGFCLRWRGQETSRAQVGELIGLREKEGTHYQWRVGVIRWMLNKSNRGLEIGVQVLAPKTLLVRMEHSRMGQPVGDGVDGLLLPSIKTIQQPPTLLAPAGRFRVGDEVLVTLGNRSLRAKLAGVGEHTSLFVQYRYTALGKSEPLASGSAKANERDGSPGSNRQFDDVWTLL
jgi:cyclic-di-GMP-binding protein